MKTVLFRAPLLTMSGYGVHARQCAKWLLKKEAQGKCQVHFDLVNWGMTPWKLKEDAFDGLASAIYAHNKPPASTPDIAVSLQLPNEWQPNLGNFNVGMTAAVETNKCNPAWVTACDKMQRVLVPSNFTKNVLQSSQPTNTQINVVPEAFSDILTQDVTEQPFDFSTPFNFLIVGQITGFNVHLDRKNIFNTIRYIFEEFKGNKNVGIVIKTNCAQNTKSDFENTQQLMKMLIKEVRQDDFPKLHLIHGNLSDAQMNALYKHPKIKAYVTLSRGEGFGIPVLEAAACALPVIATNWSGYLDFMNKGKFIKVDYSLQDVHKSKIDENIFMTGSKWAEANEKDFKKKIAKFYESNSIPKQWAIELQKTVLEQFSQNAIENYYDAALGDLL